MSETAGENRKEPLVLVADDDALTRLLAEEALGCSGFTVLLAEDGESAVRLTEERAPDVVLLDIVMPGIDGFAVCSAIRASERRGETPIVLMTGLDDAESIDRAYHVGATDFVTKPVHYAILAHRLRYILRATRSMAESRHNERMAAAASVAKSSFLANMSHEIRTPMNGILGLVELMLSEPLSAPQQSYAQDIRTCTVGLLRVLNDILDFSKIEAGRMTIVPADVCVRTVLSDTIQLLRLGAQEKEVGLVGLCSPEVPDRLLLDGGRLSQVLLNLIGNAVKFTQIGRIDVSVTSFERTESSTGICFQVRDTGPGIALENQGALFQNFSQVDASASRRFGGTGLGLAISKRIVELMGGEMELVTEPGVGSTFSFRVRAEIPRGQTAVEALVDEPETWSFDGKRALVAEDNPVNQRVSYGILTKLGCVVDLASDGAEAVAMAMAKDYDFILMDCQMPGLNGWDATRELRAGCGDRPRVPIIAFTASAMLGDRERCLEAGMDGFLTKPVRPKDLALEVGAVIRRAQECAQEPPPETGVPRTGT